jgi:hypothetical protein
MKKNFFMLIFIPVLLFAHIKDERLFKTGNVPPSALILLDRSGSMGTGTEHWEITVTLNDYTAGDNSTRLTGWYDTDMAPDGPGAMSDFIGDDPNTNWVLVIEWDDWFWNELDLSWTLKIMTDGVWHTFDGGSYEWDGWGHEERDVTIDVSGLGESVQDVECYVDVETFQGLKIGETRISLVKTPSYLPYKSTRIKDALIVIHSLLDADNDGFVTNRDEEYLPIYLGQGFHRNASSFNPGDYSYVYNESYGSHNRGESYNESTLEWESASYGPLGTDQIGSHFTDVWNHINFTSNGGHTPNGQLIAEGVRCIKEWKKNHPELWCMQHNIILIADGESNIGDECGDWSSQGSHEVVLQAYRAWHEEGIRVYAVGFGTGITENGANELNWVAFHGGTQMEDSTFIDSMINNHGMDTTVVAGSSCGMANPHYNFLTGYASIATDVKALASSLSRIFLEISRQTDFSYASGEVTSVEEEFLSTQYEARLFFAIFNPDTSPIWNGDLKAIKLDTGEFSLDSIPSELLIWSAGESLKVDKSATSRNILGVKSNGNMLPFNTTNFDSADLEVHSYEVANVIDVVRDGVKDDNIGQLGDIFHSSPLRIHAPNYFYVDQGFNQFYYNMKSRSALLYAGANDGMLHVFADSISGQSGRGGEEIAGIIPMNFISKVRNLLYGHDYFVDADPVAADVWFPESGDDSVKQWSEWHTVLIACQGEGGRSFTALDVTDPLGETSHPMDSIAFLFGGVQSTLLKDTLGFTTSTPAIHKVRVNWTGNPNKTIDRFYAFMGGGQWPEPMDIHLLDSVFSGGEVEGNVIVGFDVWKAAQDGINGNVYLIPAISRDVTFMNMPFTATPAMINIDPEVGNRFDLLFIPDAAGQLWVVDMRNPDPYAWKAERIFVPQLPASSDSSELYNWHPAFYRPLVWKDPAYNDYWIAFGTGNRSDIFAPSEDRFYCLKYPAEAIEDTTVEIPVYGEGNLGVPGIPTSAGWMLTLSHTNEKVVTQPIYYLDSLKFFTFSPGASDTVYSPCAIGGAGSLARSYTFDIRTGGTEVIAGIIEGTGMPQPPSYSFTLGGKGVEISQLSGKVKIESTKGFKSYKEIVKWKEE